MSLERVRWWHLSEVVRCESVLFAPEDWSLETWLSELAQPGNDYCLDVEHGEVRAMGGIAVTPYRESYLQTLGVIPAHQRHGLGRRLLAGLMARAAHRGALTMGLEVRDGNLPGVSLYENAGFVVLGRRLRYYEHSGADALVMGCDDLPAAIELLGGAPEVAW